MDSEKAEVGPTPDEAADPGQRMTPRALAEKILSRIGNYGLADPTYDPDLKAVETLLSEALLEAMADARRHEREHLILHGDSYRKGLAAAYIEGSISGYAREEKKWRDRGLEEAAKIAEDHEHNSLCQDLRDCPDSIAAQIRRRAGEL